jgi:hypothetical protein
MGAVVSSSFFSFLQTEHTSDTSGIKGVYILPILAGEEKPESWQLQKKKQKRGTVMDLLLGKAVLFHQNTVIVPQRSLTTNPGSVMFWMYYVF